MLILAFVFLSTNLYLFIALEECQARALVPEEGFEGLESLGLDADGATFDSCGSVMPAAQTLSTVTRSPSAEEPGGMEIHLSPSASPAPSHHPTPPVSCAGSPPLSHGISCTLSSS